MLYISFDIGIKNLALCILEHNDNTINIIDWRVITLANSKKEGSNIDTLSNAIYIELDNIVGLLSDKNYKIIDKVIIENQPSNLNGIMKTIQHLIFSYFNLLRHWDNIVTEVILINASHKLQNHTFKPQHDTTEKLTRRDKYKLNKQDGIEICKYYLRNNEILLKYFNSNKKKDDLADSCLQTVSYIRKQGNHSIEDISLSQNCILET